MKKLFLLFFLLAPLSLKAQIAAPPLGDSVAADQQKVWDLGNQLNDATLNLNLMKLDWQRGKWVQIVTQAQDRSDTMNAAKAQQKIDEIDHRKDVEKQRHDLNAQILLARQANDQGKVDSLMFQLKGLQ